MTLTSKVQTGFTLIEVVIVILIVGILAGTALPTYAQYVTRTKRDNAMIYLQQMALKIESEKLIYHKYSNIPLSRISTRSANLGEFYYPTYDDALYKVSYWDVSSTPSQITTDILSTKDWQIRAIPISTSRMKNNGLLSIDSKGERCWKTSCGMNDEWHDES